jgi:hypothetical protein
MKTPTIYLKAPFLKLIREKKTQYLIRLEPSLVQWEKKTIYLSDAQRTIPVFITLVERLPVNDVPWKVLDSIGYQSHQAMIASLRSFYGKREIKEIYLLTLLVQ